MTQSLTKRNFGLSYCRALATIAIITLHIGFVLSTTFNFVLSDKIALRMFVNCSMWAVPIFLMVTGVLNLDPDKTLTISKLVKKYIYRIFLSIVIFVAIYQIVDILIENKNFNLVQEILLYLENLYRGRTYSPMWYLYMLIGLYLMMPMYRAFVKVGTDSEIKFVLLVYVLFISIIPTIGVFKFSSGFYIHELTIYPFYMILGYILSSELVKISQFKSAIIFISSSILLLILTYVRWKLNIKDLEVFWGYSSIIVILQSVGIFNVIVKMDSSRRKTNNKYNPQEINSSINKIKNLFSRLLLKIDTCSFGIYLIHIIVIRIFVSMDIARTIINVTSIHIIIPLLTISILLRSYITTKVLKKFPVFKFIL